MLKSIIFASFLYNGICTNVFQHSKIRTPKRENTYDVVIIGAGWAGLGSGNALLSQEITNFQILEARDVIGGRSKTVYDFGENLPLDLGSEWVTGTRNNPVYEVVVENNIPSSEEEFIFDVYRPNGKRMNRLVATALVSGYFASFNLYRLFRQRTDKSDKALQEVMDDFKVFLPYGDCGRIFFDAFIDIYIETEAAADTSDMSLKYHNANAVGTGGEAFMGVPNGGYKTIVDKYAESILPKIKLESKVTSVDYSTIPVNITYEDLNGTSFVQANKVIVTLPIGVLRKGNVNFTPSLPSFKQNAIDNIGPGEIAKVLLYWEGMTDDEIFWSKDVHTFELIASESEKQGLFSIWLSSYNYNGNIPYLRCYLTGKHAVYVESIPDEQVVEEAVSVLRSYFGDDKVPDPSNYIVTDWLSDEFTLGAYSYHQVGSNRDTRNELFAPLDDRLYFAGEATSCSHAGFTHGALTSGVDAVNAIIGNELIDGECISIETRIFNLFGEFISQFFDTLLDLLSSIGRLIE